MTIDGWTITKVKRGWWAASYEGKEAGRGGYRQMFLRAFGRLPTTAEIPE